MSDRSPVAERMNPKTCSGKHAPFLNPCRSTSASVVVTVGQEKAIRLPLITLKAGKLVQVKVEDEKHLMTGVGVPRSALTIGIWDSTGLYRPLTQTASSLNDATYESEIPAQDGGTLSISSTYFQLADATGKQVTGSHPTLQIPVARLKNDLTSVTVRLSGLQRP